MKKNPFFALSLNTLYHLWFVSCSSTYCVQVMCFEDYIVFFLARPIHDMFIDLHVRWMDGNE